MVDVGYREVTPVRGYMGVATQEAVNEYLFPHKPTYWAPRVFPGSVSLRGSEGIFHWHLGSAPLWSAGGPPEPL